MGRQEDAHRRLREDSAEDKSSLLFHQVFGCRNSQLPRSGELRKYI
jgi:hypothetical protein